MSDFPEKEQDNVNSMAIMVIGLATAAILWASVIALQAYFEDTEGEIAGHRATIGRADEVRGLKSSQSVDLGKTTYADPNKGTLKRLSIDNAKRVVVRDAKAGAPTLIPTLGLLNVPTVPAAAGKPAINSAVPVEAPAPAPADPAATPAEALPGGSPPAEAAPGGSPPAEAAPAAPVAPAPAAGTNP